MIIRVVKLTFRNNETDNFTKLFDEVKTGIIAFEGCQLLHLLQDVNRPNIFFTYSYWDSEDSLEQYRNSDFFKTTWSKTKTLFDKKAEAWTVNKIAEL